MPGDSVWTTLLNALGSPSWIVLTLVLAGQYWERSKQGGALGSKLDAIKDEIAKLNTGSAVAEGRITVMEERIERVEERCDRRHEP